MKIASLYSHKIFLRDDKVGPRQFSVQKHQTLFFRNGIALLNVANIRIFFYSHGDIYPSPPSVAMRLL